MTEFRADSVYRDPNSNEAVLRYRERFHEHHISPATIGWRAGTQEIRFDAFLKGFDVFRPDSLLDIGCGFGDLLLFLRQQGWEGTYIGIDIVPEFIDAARTRFSGEKEEKVQFICTDFMEWESPVVADAAFASGLLNHRRSDDNMIYLETFLKQMKRYSRGYSALDFLSATSDRCRPDLFFFDSSKVLSVALRQTKRVILDHSYMPFEFMLKLYWRNSFGADAPVFRG